MYHAGTIQVQASTRLGARVCSCKGSLLRSVISRFHPFQQNAWRMGAGWQHVYSERASPRVVAQIVIKQAYTVLRYVPMCVALARSVQSP